MNIESSGLFMVHPLFANKKTRKKKMPLSPIMPNLPLNPPHLAVSDFHPQQPTVLAPQSLSAVWQARPAARPTKL